MKLTKLYTIEGYPEGADSTRTFSLDWNSVKANNKGYLFIRDESSGSIRVFDKDGKFLNNITNTGMGPEEIEDFRVFYFDKDTLCVLDGQVKHKKFLLNGKFVGQQLIENDIVTLPLKYYELNDSTILARKNTYRKLEKGIEIGCSLVLTDKNLRDRKIICEPLIDYNIDGDNIELKVPIFAFNKDNIYVTNRSKSEYKIDVYSHAGIHLKTINKNYIKTKFSKRENDVIKEEFKDAPIEDINRIFNYKSAIQDIFTDKYGNLWVQRDNGRLGEDLKFDIFENDKLITKISIKNNDQSPMDKWVYLKEKLYIQDFDNGLIEVYDYEFE